MAERKPSLQRMGFCVKSPHFWPATTQHTLACKEKKKELLKVMKLYGIPLLQAPSDYTLCFVFVMFFRWWEVQHVVCHAELHWGQVHHDTCTAKTHVITAHTLYHHNYSSLHYVLIEAEVPHIYHWDARTIYVGFRRLWSTHYLL